MGRGWILLEYDSEEKLATSIEDRKKRVLFYPSIGKMQVGKLIDIEVAVGTTNILIPMKAMVVARRVRPRGTHSPRGVYLEVIDEDAERFKRLCSFVDGEWRPGHRRAAPRLRAEFSVSYYLPPRYLDGRTLDISHQGMFIRTEAVLPRVGQGLFVRLHTSPLWFSIPLSTRVCWIDQVDGRRGMGLHCFEPHRSMKRLAVLAERLRRRMRP